MVKNFINYFIPESYKQDDLEYRKANTLVWAMVISILFLLNYCITCYIIGFKIGVMSDLLAAIIDLILLFIFRATGNIKLVSNTLMLFNTACIAVGCWYSGGYHSSVFPWFVAPPIIVMLISDKFNGWFWMIVNVCIVLWLCILNIQGYVWPEAYNLEMKGGYETICYVGLVIMLFLVSLAFENTKNKALNQVVDEKQRSDELLLNVLPLSIANRLKIGEQPIADHFEEASVVFMDIANFTKLSAGNQPKYIVDMLNDVFTQIDKLCMKYGMEKIKTIGDCYMAASGIPYCVKNNAEIATQFSLDVMRQLKNYTTSCGSPINFRVGLECGPVVAGVIGENKFIYDLWGDTVNTASRMESTGVVGAVHCTDNFKKTLEKQSSLKFEFEDRSEIEVKGKGLMRTWLIS